MELNKHEQTVVDSIQSAMKISQDNMVDGRHKSMVYSKLEEALLLVHADKIQRQLKY
jgi:hypothetical protein